MNTQPERKAVRDSEDFWQLDGESELYVLLIPNPPAPGGTATVRLTHSNSYGPFDDAEFFVRLGNPDQPTEQGDLESHADWIKADLVEELVQAGEGEILRSEAEEPFEDETPWSGTYEAALKIPAGRHSIEIKIVSGQPDLLRSLVLSDWIITAE
jgi:hypothetical protein